MDITTVAKMAGVSRATVSRYLNDGYVSSEKRRAIARVIKETGYIPSRQAKQLRTGKTNLVGVIIPKINSVSISRMVEGLTSQLNDSQYQILLANTDNDEKLEVDYLRLFAEKSHVDGVILVGTVLTSAHERAMDELRVPLVVLGQDIEGRSCVYNDDYHSIRDITALALDHATKPAYIGVTERDLAAGRARHRGFLDACKECGLEVSASAQLIADFTVESGYLSCERLLESHPDVDTVICASDSIAFGAMSCLREYGRSIPDDVQVTGTGDSELTLVVTSTLTTVHHHYKTAGKEAARMLVDAMGKTTHIPCEIRLGYEVLARGSIR